MGARGDRTPDRLLLPHWRSPRELFEPSFARQVAEGAQNRMGGDMNARWPFGQLAGIVSAAALTVATHSQAQITPLVSEREVFAQVALAGLTNGYGMGSSTEPDQFGPFVQSWSPHVEELGPCYPGSPDECTISYCDAFAGQNSSIFGAGIQFSGEGAGSWDGESEGAYKFRSICKFRFRIEVPVDYDIQLAAEPGDLPPGAVFATLEGPTPAITFHYTQFGILQASGQLGPGEYVIQGQTTTDTRHDLFTSGGAYSGIFFVNPIDTLDIGGYPFDQNVACGGTATFSVSAIGSPGTLSYQWRRGLTPLTNDGHFSGVNSPTLTINNACTSDAGYYSVVVTIVGSNPVLTIPSRFAQLTIVSTPTGVAVDEVSPARVSSFAPPSPNPFRVETALRYTVPPSTRVVAAVYDASGARVRSLMNAVMSGSGSIAWDGRTQAGSRAPAGVYFVHIKAGTVRETKKLVLLR